MIKLQARLLNGSGYKLVKEENQVVTSVKRDLVDCGRFTERTVPIFKVWLEQIDLHRQAVDRQNVDSQNVDSRGVGSQAVMHMVVNPEREQHSHREGWSKYMDIIVVHARAIVCGTDCIYISA